MIVILFLVKLFVLTPQTRKDLPIMLRIPIFAPIIAVATVLLAKLLVLATGA